MLKEYIITQFWEKLFDSNKILESTSKSEWHNRKFEKKNSKIIKIFFLFLKRVNNWVENDIKVIFGKFFHVRAPSSFPIQYS